MSHRSKHHKSNKTWKCFSDYSFCNIIHFRYDSINYSEIADRDFEINARNEWTILGSCCLWLCLTRSPYCVSRQSSRVWRNTKLWRTFFVKQPGQWIHIHFFTSSSFALLRWWQLQLQFVETVLAWLSECLIFRACKMQFLTLVGVYPG